MKPTGFPDAPAAWPPHVRRYLAHLSHERLSELHGGLYGVVEYLYRGQVINGVKVPWKASAVEIWPLLKGEADAYEAERKAKRAAAAAPAELAL